MSNNKTPPDDYSSQLVKLEEKISFQQHTLDELNSVVLKQQTEIDRLASEIKSLRSVTQGLADRDVSENLPHEKPPHY